VEEIRIKMKKAEQRKTRKQAMQQQVCLSKKPAFVFL
jgi:hypothetical protein